MKRFRLIYCLFISLIFSVFLISSVSAADYNTVVQNMSYDMKVNENHTYDITITETVDFRGYQHGIYRAITQSGTFYREVDGNAEEKNYHAVISNIRVESGQPYSTEREGDAYIIYIGDPDYYVTGVQQYQYSYTYDPGDEGYDSFDDVFQNILSGDYFENPIENLQIRITMPKAFDSKEVYFYAGSYGETDSNEISYSVSGNTIEAHSLRELYPGTSVTCRIVLPEGYFVGARTGREMLPVYYGGAGIAVIVSLLAYFFLGRGKKPLEPVEFYPPDGFDSAQVAFVLNNTASNEALVSLLIYFADKGWLSIENVSPNQNNQEFIIHRLSDIPTDRPSFERTIFNAIFSRSDDPYLTSLTNTRRMGTAFITAKEQLANWFSGNNAIKAPGTYISKTLIFLAIVIAGVTYAIANSGMITGYVDLILVILFSFLTIVGPTFLAFSTDKKSKIKAFIIIAICGLVNIFLSLASYNLILPILSIAIGLGLGYLGSLCNKMTEKGYKWLGECRGFRHFIQTAELNRLKLLVEENPQYYYNVLPFAYAMGLTDKWARNFEGIALNPPDWYYDPYLNTFDLYRSMYFMNMFNRQIARNVASIQTESLRSMGSRGFGGGGFGGGGGFAGGGGGGLGGGSW